MDEYCAINSSFMRKVNVAIFNMKIIPDHEIMSLEFSI